MIRVGTAGWSYADWEGRAFPRVKPPGFHPLRHLARYVDCVEINSSFYALPDPGHVARWVDLIEGLGAFRFTVKLLRDFTHDSASPSGVHLADLARRFRHSIGPLLASQRCGALLAQFPASFRHSSAGLHRLEVLADLFGELPRALELRHGSWFGPEILATIERQGWSLAEIDLPAPPAGAAVWHPPREAPCVGPLGYLRLHGRNSAAWFDPDSDRDAKYDYLYTQDEVDETIARARRLAGGRDETYVVTNNHFGGQALANALELRAGLRGERVSAPAELVRAFPRLASATRVEGQRELFG